MTGTQSVTSNTHLAAVLRIGQQIGKSHRTVERWMRGDGKPSPLIIIQLLRVNDAFAAALLRVAGWAEAAPMPASNSTSISAGRPWAAIRRLAASLGRRFALWREDRLMLRAEWWAALARRWL